MQQISNLENIQFKIFPLLLLILVLSIPIDCIAQQLEWRYEYDTGERTIPGDFWIDEDGKGYFNVLKTNPKYPLQFDRSHSLLILNEDGAYNGSVYIKHCGRGGLLLPFANDKYLLSGVDCKLDSQLNYQSYLLNDGGQIIKEGKGFEGNHFARQASDEGYIYFSKPTGNFSHTYLSIGLVDNDFKISNDSIPLAPLEREDLGMAFNYIDPVQLENKSWILPFNYGKVSSGISLDHGSVFCVKDEKILWQYPDTLSSYTLETIAGNGNTVTLFMEKSSRAIPKLFVQLDADGNVIQSTSFRIKRWSLKELQVDEEHIIILTSNDIFWYDWEGNLVGEYDLMKDNISGRDMRLLPDGSIVVAGTKHNNSVFIKLSLENSNLPTQEEEEKTNIQKEIEANVVDEIFEVSYADASLESEYVFSASVFPNPTSLRINFELSGINGQSNPFLLEVFDNSGRRLFQDKFESNFYELNVFDFTAGTYVYRISEIGGSSKKIISGRFIKIDD